MDTEALKYIQLFDSQLVNIFSMSLTLCFVKLFQLNDPHFPREVPKFRDLNFIDSSQGHLFSAYRWGGEALKGR